MADVKMKSLILAAAMLPGLCSCAKEENKDGSGSRDDNPQEPEVEYVTYGPESAVALSPAGNEIGFDYPDQRDRKTGIFYFLWIGAHGYDNGANTGYIPEPQPSDVNSPYDISELEKLSTSIKDIPFGPAGAMHHWGKPYLDYYVSNDEWVIRKHAQWLSEAGIDAIFIDMTNGFAYSETLQVLVDVYMDIRTRGGQTPQISFVLNSSPENVMPEINKFLTNPAYNQLWFKIDGKPLVMAPESCRSSYSATVTFRQCWFDTHGMGGSWWKGTDDQWTWGDLSPQTKRSEEMSVMAASHPKWEVGRSFSGTNCAMGGSFGSGTGSQPATSTEELRAQGLYFQQQFKRAVECDPEIIFITGWNEWVAQKQVATSLMKYLGQAIPAGGPWFYDCYNHEFSRDIEPCANDFKDIYYYYMADYVRQYKGVRKVKPVARRSEISIDGSFDDWKQVGSTYTDYEGDVVDRNHHGFGYRNIHLTNTTGRNDIVECKVAADRENVYFYVKTANDLTSSSDPDWMKLYLGVGSSKAQSWEGFNYLVGEKVGDKTMSLSKCDGGWKWSRTGEMEYSCSGCELELKIPMASLGIAKPDKFTIDFKWVDNAGLEGDICKCMTDGDSAPDNRWRYRYIFER